MEFNKTLLLVVSLSSLLLSCNAVPSSFLGFNLDFSFGSPPETAPSPSPATETAPSLALATEIVPSLTLAPETAPSPAPSRDGIEELTDGVGTGLLDKVKASLAGTILDSTVSNLCKDAENITLCINTIAPFMHGQADPVKALEIEIDALFKQTEKVDGIVTKLIAYNHGGNKNLADTLKVCKDNYNSNLDDIKKAVKAVKKVDIGTAQSMLSSVIGVSETCKDTFRESGLEFPFPDDSDAVTQLAGNCLGILNIIRVN
ncbi:hypothetical protein L6164_034788 [Bauhinia variegata]|uniref:Uncharacterized protein n=1 Tax=Bauhinia variegata TaxID=167791 RepID=A0ACB9KW62_BAUVA|nr:hypothetical protein L6164_034788 [Bauhinia variegata]